MREIWMYTSPRHHRLQRASRSGGLAVTSLAAGADDANADCSYTIILAVRYRHGLRLSVGMDFSDPADACVDSPESETKRIKEISQSKSIIGWTRGISGPQEWCSSLCSSSTDTLQPSTMKETQDDALSELSMIKGLPLPKPGFAKICARGVAELAVRSPDWGCATSSKMNNVAFVHNHRMLKDLSLLQLQEYHQAEHDAEDFNPYLSVSAGNIQSFEELVAINEITGQLFIDQLQGKCARLNFGSGAFYGLLLHKITDSIESPVQEESSVNERNQDCYEKGGLKPSENGHLEGMVRNTVKNIDAHCVELSHVLTNTSSQEANSNADGPKLLKVQFNVKVDRHSLSTQKVLECTTVKELIESCCKERAKHFYGVFCGKVLSDEKLLSQCNIRRDSIVNLTSRLRGGQLETYRTKFSVPDDLFSAVTLPRPLQNPALLDNDSNTLTSVVQLKRCTRFWLKEVFIFFTGRHRDNACYNGNFGEDDILFENGKVHMRPGIDEEIFSEAGCKLDYEKLNIILTELKTSDGYQSPYFDHLLSYLKRCPAGAGSRSNIAISFLINHPAIEHFYDRMKQIMLADNILFRIFTNPPKFSYLHTQDLNNAMGVSPVWWSHLVTCPEMNRVYVEGTQARNGRSFVNTLYTTNNPRGCLHYSNNYFKHADNNLVLEEVEAAYSINIPDFLPSLLESITCFAIQNASFALHFWELLELIGNDLADPHSAVS